MRFLHTRLAGASNMAHHSTIAKALKKLLRRYLALARRERFCQPLKRQQNRFRTTVLSAARCLVSILYYFRYKASASVAPKLPESNWLKPKMAAASFPNAGMFRVISIRLVFVGWFGRLLGWHRGEPAHQQQQDADHNKGDDAGDAAAVAQFYQKQFAHHHRHPAGTEQP